MSDIKTKLRTAILSGLSAEEEASRWAKIALDYLKQFPEEADPDNRIMLRGPVKGALGDWKAPSAGSA